MTTKQRAQRLLEALVKAARLRPDPPPVDVDWRSRTMMRIHGLARAGTKPRQPAWFGVGRLLPTASMVFLMAMVLGSYVTLSMLDVDTAMAENAVRSALYSVDNYLLY